MPSAYHGAEPLASKGGKRAQAALDRLGEGVRSVYDSERWESWLKSLSRFYDYSLGNTILIAMQMPTATHVASFRSWRRDFNRHVRKGERGIEILVPMLVKDRDEDADEEKVKYFQAVMAAKSRA